MVNVIKSNDATYSPLALYHLLDNNLLENNDEINILFNELIEKTNLENEIKNLIIYKKALFNSDFVNESELLETIKPLLKKDTLWKPHGLLLLGDYFVSKGENIKAIEFYQQIFSIKNLHKNLYDQAKSQLVIISHE